MAVQQQQQQQQDPLQLIYVLYRLIKSGKKPSGGTPDEITEFLTDNDQDVTDISDEYSNLSQDELEGDKDFLKFYSQFAPESAESTESIPAPNVPAESKALYAAKGAVLKKLNDFKKSQKTPNESVAESISNPVITQGKKGMKLSKCKCGCAMSMEDGGKLLCKCCGGGKMKPKKKADGGFIAILNEFKKGGKVIKGQKGLDGETWSPDEVGKGNKSMNPNDWVKSKEEMATIKKSNNDYHVSKLKKPESKKINTEIVPLKPEKKDFTKLVKEEKKGGKVQLIKKKQLGGIAKPKTIEVGKEQSTIKNYVKTSKEGGKTAKKVLPWSSQNKNVKK